MGALPLSDIFEEAENSPADRSRSTVMNSLSGSGTRSSTVENNDKNRFSSGLLLCAFIVISPTNPALFEPYS